MNISNTELTSEEIKLLISEATKAREFSYAPYSNFPVGAALLTCKNIIYTGCNIENASFSATNCAERTALFKAVSDGVKKFKAIAIVSDLAEPAPPCGTCRQVLYEFGSDIKVIIANLDGSYKIQTIIELLPSAFDNSSLNKDRKRHPNKAQDV